MATTKTSIDSISIRHRLEYVLLKGVETLLLRLPLRMVETLGRSLGSLVWLIFPVRWEVVFTNLSKMLPGLTQREKYILTHRIYRHHGYELFTYLTLSGNEMRDRIRCSAVIRGKKCLDQALTLGRGVILTGLHFGFWEASSAWLCLQGYPLTGVYRVQKNPLADRFFLARRKLFGDQVRHVARDNAGQIVKELKSNRLIAIFMDQRAGIKGTRVRFMNQDIQTPKGAAFLHMRTGAPILWIFPRVHNGRFLIEFGEFDIPRFPRISEESLQAITQTIINQLEQNVRKYPQQWFWFHKIMPKKSYPRRLKRSWTEVFGSLLLS